MDMREPRGCKLPISLPRRWIGDLLHFARKVPGVVVQREMDLTPLVQARFRAGRRISWCALFTRAYALTAAQTPELRRAYIPFPWPHIYEHPRSVASVAVERLFQGERAVFFAHLLAPETQTLEMLDEHLRSFKEQPVESFGLFRRALRVSRLPRPLRRLFWWVGLNSSGYKRARRMGTFGVSVYSSLGAESYNHLTPLSTTLNYGVIGRDGRVAVRIIYDHRVMDGGTVARALQKLEQVLNEDIVGELGGAAGLVA
jgi:hypothetical protein